jgi:hypothetical protein
MLQLLVLLLLSNNLSVQTVLDQTQPPASVLMVHNHNHSLSHSMLQLLVLLLLPNNFSAVMAPNLMSSPASVLMVHNHNIQYNNNLLKHLEIEMKVSFQQEMAAERI